VSDLQKRSHLVLFEAAAFYDLIVSDTWNLLRSLAILSLPDCKKGPKPVDPKRSVDALVTETQSLWLRNWDDPASLAKCAAVAFDIVTVERHGGERTRDDVLKVGHALFQFRIGDDVRDGMVTLRMDILAVQDG